MSKLYAFLVTLLFGGFALAEVAEPETLEQAVGLIPLIFDAAANGHFLAMGAAITVLVTFLFKKYIIHRLGLGTGVLPIVAGVVGLISGGGLAVMNGAEPMPALLAVFSGPAAVYFYDLILKYFFPQEA